MQLVNHLILILNIIDDFNKNYLIDRTYKQDHSSLEIIS